MQSQCASRTSTPLRADFITLRNARTKAGPVKDDQNNAIRKGYVDGQAAALIESSFRTKSNKFLPARYSAELNNRLLSFSPEQSLQMRNVDKNLLMTEMEEFFSRILGENILLATGFTERRLREKKPTASASRQ